MSDDISIPGPRLQARAFNQSYRTRRSARGGEGTRLLSLVGIALGVLLVVGMVVWGLMGRHSGAIPIVEADPRPIRVKPADPGGMQVVGANVEMGGASTAGDGKMAPPPEAPAPQALRAQMQSPAAPAPTPVPAALTITDPAPPAPTAAPAAPAAPVPITTVTASPTRPISSTMLVQLAALGSEQAAQTMWQTLTKRMPELLESRQPVVQRAEKGGHPIWRLRTGGFTDIADATGFCDKVRAKRVDCTIASF